MRSWPEPRSRNPSPRLAQESRRATRSSGKGFADEWLKMPVTARVYLPATGGMEMLSGFVYLSVETARESDLSPRHDDTLERVRLCLAGSSSRNGGLA